MMSLTNDVVVTPAADTATTTVCLENAPLSVNVGIMGHVDAGKTSLARFISDVGSTAAFDRHPASQQRGITLDLGFSRAALDKGIVTLVDCPGHGSLLRMVLGAASIIDAVILVVDATEGVQAQTAECLVLAELVTTRLLVALTKVDKLEMGGLEKVTKSLRRVLRETVFGRERDSAPTTSLVPIVPVSPRLPETRESFLKALETFLFPPGNGLASHWAPQRRLIQEPALVAIDHCFTIKGQGAILTGTVLRGSLCSGDMVEIGAGTNSNGEQKNRMVSEQGANGVSGARPKMAVGNLRRIKSLQMFKRPVDRVQQGDRVGINLGSGLDTSHWERALLTAPGLLKTSRMLFLEDVKPVRYYRYAVCRSRDRLHLSVLHQTTMVTILFLRRSSRPEDGYELVEKLAREEYEEDGVAPETGTLQALITAAVPIVATPGLLAIASKLDIDQLQSQRHQEETGARRVCRLVFSATVARLLEEGQKVNIYRWRQRTGTIDRLIDEHRLIGTDLSETSAGLRQFIGKECCIIKKDHEAHAQGTDDTNGVCNSAVIARGIISSLFGTSGKFNVNLMTTSLPREFRRQDYLILVRYKKYN